MDRNHHRALDNSDSSERSVASVTSLRARRSYEVQPGGVVGDAKKNFRSVSVVAGMPGVILFHSLFAAIGSNLAKRERKARARVRRSASDFLIRFWALNILGWSTPDSRRARS